MLLAKCVYYFKYQTTTVYKYQLYELANLYKFFFCSTPPVYKILDKYLSKQQLKIVTVLKEFIGKNEGMFFQHDFGKGR
jgi:hypothetical protein